MNGRPNRFLVTRERIAVFALPIRQSDTLPVLRWTPYIPSYFVSDMAFRFYLMTEGLDDEIAFDPKVSVRSFGTTGTAPNDIPNTAHEDYVRAVQISLGAQNGAPQLKEMTSALESTGRNFTHLSLGVNVTTWNPTFDHLVICEFWANAWRNYRASSSKASNHPKSGAIVNLARTDMRLDLETSRYQPF